VAQGIDLMAGDRHQIGAVGQVGLVGAVDRGAPVGSAADHRRGQHLPDIALGDQVLDVVDRRRHLALQLFDLAFDLLRAWSELLPLQPDRMPDADIDLGFCIFDRDQHANFDAAIRYVRRRPRLSAAVAGR
jgi:hypothetical protein